MKIRKTVGIDLGTTNSRFNPPACQEQVLAQRMPAVAIPKARQLASRLEHLTTARARRQVADQL